MNDSNIKERIAVEEDLQQLVSQLSDTNGMTRRHAREALEHAGKAATPYLIPELSSPLQHTRWEAAKALTAIVDPEAAPALVRTLMDESFEVQWLAAEALIALGPEALAPLLEGIIHNYGSVYMRQGAHHVLHDLERRELLSPHLLTVLDELRTLEPLEPYPVSARRALKELQGLNYDTAEQESA